MSRRPRAGARRRRFGPRGLRATRAGWCYIGIIFGVGFAALNTGNNLLYLVLALMLAFLVLSGLLSEASLRGIRLERRLPRELFAERPARVVLRVHNDQRRAASLALSLEDRCEAPDGPAVVGRSFALRIPPRGCVERSYRFEPQRRGPLEWVGIRLSTRFPFGLFVKSAEIECHGEALVYPAVEPLGLEPPAAQDARPFDEGSARARSGDELEGLREYAPGDTPGRIQWRPSLRAQRWLVGERGGEGAAEVEIRLDLPAAEPLARLEARIARAASESVSHLDAGRRVGLRTPTAAFPARAGFEQRTALLSHLARLDPRDPAMPRGASHAGETTP